SAAPVLFSLPSLFKHLHFKYTQSQCHLSQHHSMARGELQPLRRSLAWRLSSSVVMGLTGAISRAFLYGLNDVQTEGLKPFLKLLDERQGVSRRQGLITVSNHISVLDDPVTWGVLPLKYAFKPRNLRWGLGAHDICFKNKFMSTFFSLGQVLPTHRLLHSPHGGLFQPTMNEAVRVLSGEATSPPYGASGPTFTTKAGEVFPAPSAYDEERNAWVHVFPEACVHQHPELSLRYFKWGVSRMILESNPAPKFVPMFIDGHHLIMHENRGKPRWLPRVGRKVRVVFGDAVDVDQVFGEFRKRWRHLVEEHQDRVEESGKPLAPEALEGLEEAIHLRKKVAELVRSQVARLRTASGYPEDDPSFAQAETWIREPTKTAFRSPVDGSFVHRE
ncbi:hypothetical protein BN1723_002000, partial [Verticillium longisporum]